MYGEIGVTDLRGNCAETVKILYVQVSVFRKYVISAFQQDHKHEIWVMGCLYLVMQLYVKYANMMQFTTILARLCKKCSAV